MEGKRVLEVVVMILLMLMFLKGVWCIGKGCWEEDRIALLQLQPFFSEAFVEAEIDESSDCCQWKNVVCNNSTGRVIELHLLAAIGTLRSTLNASLFLPFDQLQVLDISDNYIAGFVENEGFEGLSSRLSHLNVLDLSYNDFKNNILSLVGGFSTLKSLKLRGNLLQKSIHIKDFLCNLEELDIIENEVEKIILPQDDKCLNKLKVLRLGSYNTGISPLLRSLRSKLPLLKTLELYANGTETSTLGLHNLTNLEELILNPVSSSPFQINFLQSLNALTSLKNLSLFYFGDINGTLSVPDLPNFKNLEKLYIHGSILNNNFLQDIGEMDALIFLSLTSTRLNGTLPSQGLCELNQLQELDLGDNNLEGDLPECLANLTSLQRLELSYNQFTGDIATSPLKRMTSIEYLSLSSNHFKIPLSLAPLFNNSRLKSFLGHDNEINDDGVPTHCAIPKFQLTDITLSGSIGQFPKFLYYQHDLQYVRLSHLRLKGGFPQWLLENNTRLVYLFLVNNSLSGTFHLPNRSHIHLRQLDVSNNYFCGKIPTSIGAYFPRLMVLSMSMNAFNGSIPSSFGDMNSLLSLDLSHNHLIGGIPKHLGIGCFALRELILSNNSLHGTILPTEFSLTKLLILRLDRNNFTGNIPDGLSNCSHLKIFDISNNQIFGRIPNWVGNMSNMRVIVVANNHVEGLIPMEFCQLDLEVLDLSHNNISGKIPPCFSPPQIYEVHLSKNRLQGTLEHAFSNSSFIKIFDLSYNNLTGEIPKWMERLSQLNDLLLNNNNLEGEIPIQLCQLDKLSVINLSHNNFFGRIPNCLHITTVKEVIVDQAFYTREVYSEAFLPNEPIEFTTKSISYSYERRILRYFFGIDLSCNKLSGKIPYELGNSINIRSLNLSHNFLCGPIPSTFANLKQIESLDLSNNNLSGTIPPQLGGLNSLSKFLVAYNNLSGKIPETPQFTTFDKNSYEANPLLCGTPLQKNCDVPNVMIDNGDVPNVMTDNGEEESGFMDMGIFYISFMVTYILVLLAIALVLYINPYWQKFWFYHIEKFIVTCYYFIIDHNPKRFCI